MPEQKKAYRRVVRNPNGIGLRIAYFDAITGEELTSLDGYTLLDQGVPNFGGEGPDTGSGSDNDDDNDGGGRRSGGDYRSSSDNESGNDFWEEWYDNPNVSRGSGNIVADLQAAFESGRKTVRDIKANAKQGALEAFGLSKADPPGFMPREYELEKFKTGVKDSPTAKEAIAGPSGQKTYDSTVGAQPPSQGKPTLNAAIKSSYASNIGEPINQFLGNSVEEFKENLFGLAKDVPLETLLNVIEPAVKALPDDDPMKGIAMNTIRSKREELAKAPDDPNKEDFGEAVLRGNFAEGVYAALAPHYGQAKTAASNFASYAGTAGGSNAPVPASKTQNIIDQQNAPNVKQAIAASQNTGGNPLEIAKAWLGYDERNPQQAEALASFFAKAGNSNSIDPATTAWCAAWLNSVLYDSGVDVSASSPWAQDLLKVGEPVDTPQIGDVVVFKWADGTGHTGLVAGINPDGSLQVLGGNQSTDESGAQGVSVNIKRYETGMVSGFRRVTPTSVQQELSDPVIKQAIANGQTSYQEKVGYINPKLSQAINDLNAFAKEKGLKPFNSPEQNTLKTQPSTGPSWGGPVVPKAEGLNTQPTSGPSWGSTPPTKVDTQASTNQLSLVDDLLNTGAVKAIGDFFGDATGTIGDAASSVMPYASPTQVPDIQQKTPATPSVSSGLVYKPESTKELTGPYALSDEERQAAIVQTVLGEAAGEGIEGMLAVANVIKNRALDDMYPPDPKDVALQANSKGIHQFSTWNSTSYGGNNPAVKYPVGSPEYKKALQVVQGVFDGTLPDNTYGAVNYHTNSVQPYWSDEALRDSKGALQIGNHTFYTKQVPDDSVLVNQASSGFMPKPAAGTPSGSGSRDTVAQSTAGSNFASSQLSTQPASGPSWGSAAPSSSSSGSSYLDQPKSQPSLKTQPSTGPSWGSPAPSSSGSSSKDTSFTQSPYYSGSSSSSKSDSDSSYLDQPKSSSTSKSTPSNATLNSFMSGPSSPKTTTSKSSTPKTTTTSSGFVKQTSSYGTTYQPGGK